MPLISLPSVLVISRIISFVSVVGIHLREHIVPYLYDLFLFPMGHAMNTYLKSDWCNKQMLRKYLIINKSGRGRRNCCICKLSTVPGHHGIK